MAFKFVVLCAALAAVNAGVIETGWQPNAWNPHATYVQPAPTIIKQVQPAIVKQVVHEAPANYEFNYDVHDPHTGDIKRQHERAENGVITGEYALVDPDGYRRTVSYTADAHNGFQAKVHREPFNQAPAHGWQPQAVKVVAPSHGWQPAQSQGWKPAPSHGWQAPTVVKVQAPSHGWQPAPSHGWQAPSVVKVQAPSHGWNANPWA